MKLILSGKLFSISMGILLVGFSTAYASNVWRHFDRNSPLRLLDNIIIAEGEWAWTEDSNLESAVKNIEPVVKAAFVVNGLPLAAADKKAFQRGVGVLRVESTLLNNQGKGETRIVDLTISLHVVNGDGLREGQFLFPATIYTSRSIVRTPEKVSDAVSSLIAEFAVKYFRVRSVASESKVELNATK